MLLYAPTMKLLPTILFAVLVAGGLAIGVRAGLNNQHSQPIAADDGEQVGFEESLEEASESGPTELDIRWDSEGFSDRTLSSGPVKVSVSYTPPDRSEPASDNLQYQLSYEDNASSKDSRTISLQSSVDAYSFSNLSLLDLDSDGISELIVKDYSGGAHCCTRTLIHSLQEGEFVEVDTGYLDGLGGRFEDLDEDGLSEFVTVDNRFLYRFSSYAGSRPPLLISTFEDGELIETTKQYPETIREQIAEVEETLTGDFAYEVNGLLAGYVAMKSLVGEYEEGWQYMLERYDPESEAGLEIRDENSEVVGRHPDFPTALAAFLDEAGY